MDISRRTFLGGSLAWTTLILAGCGAAASQPSTAPASSAAAPASAKPVTSAPASAKPAGSAAASAASKPAASGSAAASPAPSVKPAAPGTANAVRGAWVAITANMMLWPLAVEAGYFDKYGINFDLKFVQGSLTSVAALYAHDLDMVSVAGTAVVNAQATKQDLVMVMSYINEVFWRIMAIPSITSIDQIKGKTVAVTKVGNADYFAWPVLLQKNNMTMQDLKFVAANDPAGQIALASNGQAQALAVSPPNDVQAKKAGMHMLLDEATLHIPEQQVGMALSKAYLGPNHDKVLNVMKATVEAIHRWKTDAEFAKKVIGKYLKSTDQDYIDTGYSAYAPLFQQDPLSTVEGFKPVIEEVATQQPAAKNVDPAACFDMSLVKELDSSGFIKQIFGS